MYRWPLRYSLLLLGCDSLVANNPANCVINANACSANQFCNQVTQSCETLDCTINSTLCSPQEYCHPTTNRCTKKDCVVDPTLCAPDQRCNGTKRVCESITFVLGQPDSVYNSGAAYGMANPQSVLLVPVSGNPGQSRLIVADGSNRRVLIWNSVPTQNRPADVVLGMPDVNTLSPFGAYGGVNEGSMLAPFSIGSDGTRLCMGDLSAHRVLTWNQIPSQPLASGLIPANRIWGQTNFQNSQADSGQPTPNNLGANGPGVFLEPGAGGRFFISDLNNNRVLVFPSLPISPQTPPSFVLGQASFTTNTAATTATAMRTPRHLFSDGNELFVPDTFNHRLLVFDLATLATSAAAKVVFGQADFTSGTANRGGPVGPDTLNGPTGAVVVSAPQRQLFIADSLNHRVLRYPLATPTAASTSPDLVLGQSNFSSGIPNRGASPGPDTMRNPVAVSSDGTRLAVAEFGNHRVLLWQTLPTQNGQAADVVLGQPDVFSSVPNNPPSRGPLQFIRPTHVATDGIRLFVVDAGNNRVLIWNRVPLNGTQPPDVVLGQSDFTGGLPNGGAGALSAATLSFPFAVTSENGRLAVSDNGHHRVLIWNQIPTQNNQPADVCIGQPDCVSAAQRATASGLNAPAGIRFAAGTLWVADNGNSRVLAFTNTTTSGAAASLVVGQPNLTSGTPNGGGQSASTLAYPRAVFVDSGRLLVADQGNHRVLVWNNLPTQNGAPAQVVIGQVDFSNSYTRSSRSRLESPTDLFIFRGGLYIASEPASRVLYFAQVPTQNGQPADRVLGQPDFVSTLPNNPDMPLEERLIGPVGLAAIGNLLFIADYTNSRVMARGLAP